MASISRSWSDAGSLPGQKQKVEVEFVSRSGHNVKVKWHFYAKSNGYDYYDYDSRHNRARIYHGEDTIRDTYNYQAKGDHASRSHTETFTITGVGNSTTSLGFWYSNQRMWPGGTNSWDPRSTGVVKKTKIGNLTIPANTSHTIKFYEVVNNKTHSYTCYHTDNFTIPNIAPTNPHYTFLGWTTTNYASSYSQGSTIPNSVLSKGSVQKSAGNSISNVTSNINYFAVWKPKTCSYTYLDYADKKITSVTHTYGTTTKLIDLDTYSSAKYKVRGYNFDGWNVGSKSGKFYAAGANCSEWNASGVTFYPKKSALLNTVVFNIQNNKKSYADYYTDAQFNMSRPLTDLSKTNITLKPGYKLVGWCTVPPKTLAAKHTVVLSPDGIAYPNRGYDLSGLKKTGNYYSSSECKIYPVSGKVVFNYDDFSDGTTVATRVLNLYPYYEYYTTTYVYYNGEWRLAMPYVYDGQKWNMALTYIYHNNTWKL